MLLGPQACVLDLPERQFWHFTSSFMLDNEKKKAMTLSSKCSTKTGPARIWFLMACLWMNEVVYSQKMKVSEYMLVPRDGLFLSRA